MGEKYCPRLEFRTFVSDKKEQRCAADYTYSPKSQCICRKGNSQNHFKIRLQDTELEPFALESLACPYFRTASRMRHAQRTHRHYSAHAKRTLLRAFGKTDNRFDCTSRHKEEFNIGWGGSANNGFFG